MRAVTLTFFGAVLLAHTASGFEPRLLWDAWPTERFVETVAPCLRPADLGGELRRLAESYPKGVRLEEAGRSAQGRPIHLVTLGRGARKVFLWSQMHGDEPSATPALLDLAAYLLGHENDATGEARRVLEAFTLLMVPMLNPDGGEIYTRRNAQGIDINRDALNLATPEGRLLKRLRDEHQPILGFNLHDQNRRRSVGDTRVLAANAILAVSGDRANTLTPGRLLAKRACSAIATALAPFAPGGMARYDEEWSPRAFGDNLTAWGTPVVLIESGGVEAGKSLSEQTRLNFVALLAVLGDLASDELAQHDPEVYEKLPENNQDEWADVAVRGGLVLQPGSPEPYRADLAFDVKRGDRLREGCETGDGEGSEIAELGDARIFGAGREIDAAGAVIYAPFRVGVRGARAGRWLDSGGLDRLARLGVAEVVWSVGRRKLATAIELVRAAEGPGRPDVRVILDERDLPPFRLRRLPDAAASTSSPGLPAMLASLAAARDRKGAQAGQELLAQLWGSPRRPPLRPEQPASFLLVGAGDEQPVLAVVLDGIEIAARAGR
jgi:hypothetical protein